MFRDVPHDDRPALSISRRELLKMACLAVGAMAVPAAYAAASAGSAEESVEGIRHLNRAEYDIFSHLVQAALPVEGTALPTPEAVNVMQTLDKALLAGMAPHILAGLKGGIAFFNDGPKERFDGRTFTQLSLDEARRFCDEWSDARSAPRRGIVMGMKKLVALSYWSNPKTWPTLNYQGPITKRTGIPSLGNAPMPA